MVVGRTLVLITSLVLSLGLVVHTLLDPAGWPRRSALTRDLLSRSSENLALEEQATQLRSEISALSGRPEAQEHIVRDELGWVRPGDVVIYFGD